MLQILNHSTFYWLQATSSVFVGGCVWLIERKAISDIPFHFIRRHLRIFVSSLRNKPTVALTGRDRSGRQRFLLRAKILEQIEQLTNIQSADLKDSKKSVAIEHYYQRLNKNHNIYCDSFQRTLGWFFFFKSMLKDFANF